MMGHRVQGLLLRILIGRRCVSTGTIAEASLLQAAPADDPAWRDEQLQWATGLKEPPSAWRNPPWHFRPPQALPPFASSLVSLHPVLRAASPEPELVKIGWTFLELLACAVSLWPRRPAPMSDKLSALFFCHFKWEKLLIAFKYFWVLWIL